MKATGFGKHQGMMTGRITRWAAWYIASLCNTIRKTMGAISTIIVDSMVRPTCLVLSHGTHAYIVKGNTRHASKLKLHGLTAVASLQPC